MFKCSFIYCFNSHGMHKNLFLFASRNIIIHNKIYIPMYIIIIFLIYIKKYVPLKETFIYFLDYFIEENTRPTSFKIKLYRHSQLCCFNCKISTTSHRFSI